MAIDARLGSAELEQLAEGLKPPCQIGAYTLDGLISKTSTALIFVARGGAFGEGEGVLKLSGPSYAPLLERELNLLNTCQAANLPAIVRPVQPRLECIELEGDEAGRVAAILLPFLAGGDLVQWIGAHATRTGRLGSHLALEVGELVGRVLRSLLQLERPLVHGDVKPQNVLLPFAGAPLAQLVLIDLDASDELDVSLAGLDHQGNASREARQRLVDDVNGFGELLFMLATGCEPPSEGEPDPASGNLAFDALVRKCLTSEVEGPRYASMNDDALWNDLESALVFERGRQRRWPWSQHVLLTRASLVVLGVLVFGALLIAVISRLLAA